MAITLRAALVSLLLFGLFVGVWHLATAGSGPAVRMDPEYAKLVGAAASQGKSAMPGPGEVASPRSMRSRAARCRTRCAASAWKPARPCS